MEAIYLKSKTSRYNRENFQERKFSEQDTVEDYSSKKNKNAEGRYKKVEKVLKGERRFNFSPCNISSIGSSPTLYTCTYKIYFANTYDDNFEVLKCYNIHMLTVKLLEKDGFTIKKLL